MATRFLEIESSLHDLLQELEGIRAAAEQVERAEAVTTEALNSAGAVTKMAEDVLRLTGNLVDEIQNARLPENVKALKDETDRMIGRQHDVLSGITLLDQRMGTILEDLRKTQESARETASGTREIGLKLQETLVRIDTLAEENSKIQADHHEQMIQQVGAISADQETTKGTVVGLSKESKIQRWILIGLAAISIANLVLSIMSRLGR